jgi:N-acetylneuraminate synthase
MKLKLISPELLVKPKIAIVASSANLLDNEYGKIIDSFSEVVRFNRAPTKGYEKHVGSKTTIRIANNHVFSNTPHVGWETNSQPTFFIKEQKNINIVHLGPELTSWEHKDAHIDASSKAFLVNYEALYENIFPLTNKNPSCGFAFLWICINSGIKPSIFGYGLDEDYGQYHDKNAISSHGPKKEKEEIKKWINEGLVEYMPPATASYIIPARRGSKGLPFKNRKLLKFTLDTIPKEILNNTIVSTNDKEIIKIVEKEYKNCKIHIRSENLSKDKISTKEVLLEVINDLSLSDDIIMLYLTYPNRTWSQVEEAYNWFKKESAKSLLCKEPTSTHPYVCLYDLEDNKGKQVVDHDLYRRQDYPECFKICHMVSIFKTKELENLNKNLYNDDTIYYEINKTLDVDTKEDIDNVIVPTKPIKEKTMAYIISEIGINHNGDMDLAKYLIKKSSDAKCNAVKFQKRTVDLVYSEEELDKPRESPWGQTNRQQKEGLEFDIAQHKELQDYSENLGLDYIVSCWDLNSLAEVESCLNTKFHKIASAMACDKKFLQALNKTNKKIILSVGMCSDFEIEKTISQIKNLEYILCCTSTYPTQKEEVNLAHITKLKKQYPKYKIGFSNHYNGHDACIGAVALGAECIEFHITKDRTMYGSDQPASIQNVMDLVNGVKNMETMLSDGKKIVYESEKPIADKLRKENSWI